MKNVLSDFMWLIYVHFDNKSTNEKNLAKSFL